MIEPHIRELDHRSDYLDLLDREIAEGALDNPAVKRLMTTTGVNLMVAASLCAEYRLGLSRRNGAAAFRPSPVLRVDPNRSMMRERWSRRFAT